MNLLLAWEAGRDETRTGIDDAVSEMLGVPGYDTDALDKIWCTEPSIRHSRSRPRADTLGRTEVDCN